MCVIFFKPTGVALPKHENIQLMYDDNKDGLGVMWADGKEVYGRKCINVPEFLDLVSDIPRKFPVVGHFRTATHGGKSLGHSQPFPFPVKKKAELFIPKWEAPLGVAHNGVLSGFGESMYGGTYSSAYYANGTYRVWENGKWEDKPYNKEAKKKEELRLSDTQDFLLFMSKNRA